MLVVAVVFNLKNHHFQWCTKGGMLFLSVTENMKK